MKKIRNIICALVLCSSLGGCTNYSMTDVSWNFDEAIVRLPNGEFVQGPVESWSFNDTGWVQVKIDGTFYYTSLTNVALIDKQ